MSIIVLKKNGLFHFVFLLRHLQAKVPMLGLTAPVKCHHLVPKVPKKGEIEDEKKSPRKLMSIMMMQELTGESLMRRV